MEPVRDPYVQYSELLNKAFDKIKKNVPKKYKELKDLCTEAQGKTHHLIQRLREIEARKGRPL